MNAPDELTILASCPFCGCAAAYYGAAVRCTSFKCNAGLSPDWTTKTVKSVQGDPDERLRQAQSETAERWNRRAPQAASATPSAMWREDGLPDPHGTRYDCDRAKLAMGDLTDDELANAVFIHGNNSPDFREVLAGTAKMPIAYLTAAKDRIRWLSRQLAAHTAPTPSDALREAARKTFPILGSGGAAVDYQLGADHGRQAQANHYQSVERLAERGGLSWSELYAVLHDRKWSKVDENLAIASCRGLEAAYLAALSTPTGVEA